MTPVPGSAAVNSASDTTAAEDSSTDAQAAESGPEISHADLLAEIGELRRSISTFAERAAFYEDLVRQLQQRVESLHTDQIQQLLGPVLQRLAGLITQCADAVVDARHHDGDYSAEIELDYFHDALIETVETMGVESVEAAAGVAFDRSLHAARKATPTGDADLDATVATVLRQGLRRPGADRAFLPAQVVVFRFDPALAPVAEDLPVAPPPGQSVLSDDSIEPASPAVPTAASATAAEPAATSITASAELDQQGESR